MSTIISIVCISPKHVSVIGDNIGTSMIDDVVVGSSLTEMNTISFDTSLAVLSSFFGTNRLTVESSSIRCLDFGLLL